MHALLGIITAHRDGADDGRDRAEVPRYSIKRGKSSFSISAAAAGTALFFAGNKW